MGVAMKSIEFPQGLPHYCAADLTLTCTANVDGRPASYAVTAEALEVLLQLQYHRTEAESMIRDALAGNGKFKSSEKLIAHIFASSQVEA